MSTERYRKLEERFDAVVDLDAVERSRLRDEECTKDGEFGRELTRYSPSDRVGHYVIASEMPLRTRGRDAAWLCWETHNDSVRRHILPFTMTGNQFVEDGRQGCSHYLNICQHSCLDEARSPLAASPALQGWRGDALGPRDAESTNVASNSISSSSVQR